MSIGASLYPRAILPRLEESLADSPVVLIHGPRQCGKTTLAREAGISGGHAYRSFDDDNLRAAAEADPIGLVDSLPDRVVLDEVQRVPGLFAALKMAVDGDRRPGRFLLTGSANVLLVPRLADSLAGRMEILRLHPLSSAELARRESTLLGSLFAGKPPETSGQGSRMGESLAEVLASGGYPAALARAAPRRRAAWYRDYIETLVQRDVREMARISSLDVLPRLLSLAAAHTATLLNVADLAAPFQLSRPTIRDYMTLLRRIFLVDELPAWHHNRLKRLVKTPKLHLGDPGLATALLGLTPAALWKDRTMFGRILETAVFQELRRLACAEEESVSFHHFRDKDGAEVDIVLESAGRIVGVEVKAAATVTPRDFSGLRKLTAAAGDRFSLGIVFFDGDTPLVFGDSMVAIPFRELFWR